MKPIRLNDLLDAKNKEKKIEYIVSQSFSLGVSIIIVLINVIKTQPLNPNPNNYLIAFITKYHRILGKFLDVEHIYRKIHKHFPKNVLDSFR